MRGFAIITVVFGFWSVSALAQSLSEFSGSWKLVAEGDGTQIFPEASPTDATLTSLVVIEENQITYITHIAGVVLPAEGPIDCKTVSTDTILSQTGDEVVATNTVPTYEGVCPDRMKSYTFEASKIKFVRESASRMKMIFTRADQKTWIYFLER